MLIFDIETGPLPPEQLKELMPAFDPSEVKTGNRGEEKAAELIEKRRIEHEVKFIENAALSAVTGQVLTIGCYSSTKNMLLIPTKMDEHTVINNFWRLVEQKYSLSEVVVGFNIFGFDLPFLIRRSWILGIDVPECLWSVPGRYFNSWLVDIYERWLCGQRQGEVAGSLDVVSRALGLPGKNGDGKDFHKLWKSDRDAAVIYVEQDLNLTFKIAERMGIH